MAKIQFTDEDDALLAELGVEVETPKAHSRSAQEERILAGFEDIQRLYEAHGHLPVNAEDNDIFERLYAVRLDKIRASEECRTILLDFDKYGLLGAETVISLNIKEDMDDDTLLAELGVVTSEKNDITRLTHVKARAEIRAAEEIARRIPCLDFDKFKSLFISVQEDLKVGVRQGRRFKENASIEEGHFFILSGQIAYVAEVGELIKAPNGKPDARLRVIYDNGTESDLLMRSLQRALYKDDTGRRVTDPSAGPLFADFSEEDDIESGTVYVLRSNSTHPFIKEHRDVIHKIGVTGGDIKKRLASAKLDPTFLMADVEVVATYKLSNINRNKLENLIHKFFEAAKLKIDINDRLGNPIIPREWFLVPLFIIDECIQKVRDGSIVKLSYDPIAGTITETF